ncbi:Rho termination factor N-terminal domain-containing protein [Halotia wernerae UHCC 0503]|nr:Rho termination factor N-terminal domain-containing protein [Halotia wernerae UHCC 0503]
MESYQQSKGIMRERILGKNLKELRAIAKQYNIKGRSKMNHEELQKALWKAIYSEDCLPNNRRESLEFLLLHPSPLVQDMSHMWMVYGGKKIIDALEVVVRCHSTILHEDKEINAIPSQAFEDMIKASISVIYTHVSAMSGILDIIQQQYYAERKLEHWEGDVLYLVSEEGFISYDSNPYKVFFYPCGKARPPHTSGWILLEPGQKELAKKLIKQQWKYDKNSQCYWVSRSDIETMQQYFEVIKTSGEINV